MSTSLPSANAARVRLHYLDGIRGVAALYVTLAHLVGFVALRNAFALTPLTKAMLHGRSAVAVFIVLSGYSLMLPLANSSDGKLRGGLKEFFARRARRILPPYYAALALTLVLNALWNAAAAGHGTAWAWIPNGWYNIRNIGMHVLLIHNFSPRYMLGMDPPTWSVAVEWQIYFLFAVLLVPVWQRWGNRGALLLGLLIGLTPPLLFPSCCINQSHPPYVLLFTLGMIAAGINFAKGSRLSQLRDRMPWGRMAALLSACLLAVILLVPLDRKSQEMIGVPEWAMDVLAGATAACFLVYFTRAAQTRQTRNPALRLLETRGLAWFSLFSYSLYLVHFPILERLSFLALQFHLSVGAQFAVLLLVGMPVVVGCSYLFHLAFERRFLSPAAKPALALPQTQSEMQAAKPASRPANNFGFLRVLLAALVILSHSWTLAGVRRAFEPLVWFTRGQIDFGALAVHGFFVISGYLIVQSWLNKPNARQYLLKRALRIYPGYITAYLFSMLMVGALGAASARAYLTHLPWLHMLVRIPTFGLPPATHVFQGLPYPLVNGSLWTIIYECDGYLLVLALGLLGLLRRRALCLLLFAAAYAGSAYLNLTHNHAEFTVTRLGALDCWLRFGSYFLAGMCLYLYRDKIAYRREWAWASLIALLVTCWTGAGIVLTLPICGAYLLLYAAFQPCRLLAQVGAKNDLSYGMYLYAWPCQILLLWHFRHIHPFALFALALIPTTLLAWLSWRYVEKPAQALAHRPFPLHWKTLPGYGLALLRPRKTVSVTTSA